MSSLEWAAAGVTSVLALFLLTSAIVVEWERISTPWRRILVAVGIEQAAITYRSVEAIRYDVPARVGVLLQILSLVVLIVALALLVVHRERGRHAVRRRTPYGDEVGVPSED